MPVKEEFCVPGPVNKSQNFGSSHAGPMKMWPLCIYPCRVKASQRMAAVSIPSGPV